LGEYEGRAAVDLGARNAHLLLMKILAKLSILAVAAVGCLSVGALSALACGAGGYS
jgi:hypothetical protein